jgi:hypothetical protein
MGLSGLGERSLKRHPNWRALESHREVYETTAEPRNSEWSTDVCFSPHSGLKSDTA